QPAVGAGVTVTLGPLPLPFPFIDQTTWMSVGQTIYISNGGYYTVTAINAALNQVTITNLGANANLPVGATVSGSVGDPAVWTDVTGNLATAEITGLASDPTNANSVFATGMGISAIHYTGGQSWNQSMGVAPGFANPNTSTVYDLNGS